MRIIFILVIWIACLGVVSAQETKKPGFIEYTLISFDDSLPIIGVPGRFGGSGGCGIDERGHCDALYYISKTSNGSIAGSIVRPSSEDILEILCSAGARLQDSQIVVSGSIYQVHVRADGEITRGRKAYFKHSGELGDTIIVRTGQLEDGTEIGMMVRALIEPESPRSCFGCTPADVMRVFSHELSDAYVSGRGKRTSANKTSFTTSFTRHIDTVSNEHLKYSTEIELSENIDSLSEPTVCSFTFARTYSFDTLRITPRFDKETETVIGRGDKFSEDVRFYSEYVKEITLIPGQIFKVVIPPDTPSVRGFDIVDTLVLMPRKRFKVSVTPRVK